MCPTAYYYPHPGFGRCSMAFAAFEIKTCSPFVQGKAFGDVGPYQQLDGTVHFAVDPHHPSNAGITDLQRTPRDAQGLVPCAADVRLLMPVALQRGNQRLLLDIVNRGETWPRQPLRQCGNNRILSRMYQCEEP